MLYLILSAYNNKSRGPEIMTEQVATTDKGTPEATDTSLTLEPKHITDYLKRNPDFFVDHEELLLDLKLPHPCPGKTISLIEKQVMVLRKKASDDQTKLSQLSENAEENEKIFERIRSLVLALLDSKDLKQQVKVIEKSLTHEFGIEFYSLILFSEKKKKLPLRVEHIDAATKTLGSIITNGKAVSGQILQEELNFLFQKQADNVKSVAITPLNHSLDKPEPFGVLALGSSDKNHFKSSMGTVFINYLGDVLSRTIAQQLDL